jgi:hypothetical protein
MTKKPLVPNKNQKGRGKGKAKAAKVGKAVKTAKAAKAARRNKICSRLSKGRLTILIAEVESIAKGLKGGLSGGGIMSRLIGMKKKTTDKKPDASPKVEDYYDRIKGFFRDENKENIKRLKEDLVNEILGTMAGGLENLVNFKTDTGDINEIKRRQLLKFISIINYIDNLDQSYIDSLILNDSLKILSYIDKITTLVMINMLKKVYRSRYTNKQLDETPFKYLNNTKSLIEKITTAYKDNDREGALKGLTEDVKRELEYYNNIYTLKDYASKKGDDNDDKVIIKIIESIKDKCIETENNEFKSFIDNPLLERDEFTTGCEKNQILINAIKDYNDIIKKMKDTYVYELDNTQLPLDQNYVNFINNKAAITKTYIDEMLLSNNGLLDRGNLYKLYGYITHYEDIKKLFPILKEKYIECVKVFYNKDFLNSFITNKEFTKEYKEELKRFSITDDDIKNLETELSRFREYKNNILQLQNTSNSTSNFYNNIPIDIEPLINNFNKLCNANHNYIYYEDIINKKIEEFKAKNVEIQEQEIKKTVQNLTETVAANVANAAANKSVKKRNLPNPFDNDIKSGNIGGGGKLTTKYISTGDFVYILYEKKRIRRCVYAKTKGRGKYCKIKGDYILVSKLKVV